MIRILGGSYLGVLRTLWTFPRIKFRASRIFGYALAILWRLLNEIAVCFCEPPGPIADLTLSSLFTNRKFSDAILNTVLFLSFKLLTIWRALLFGSRPRAEFEEEVVNLLGVLRPFTSTLALIYLGASCLWFGEFHFGLANYPVWPIICGNMSFRDMLFIVLIVFIAAFTASYVSDRFEDCYSGCFLIIFVFFCYLSTG